MRTASVMGSHNICKSAMAGEIDKNDERTLALAIIDREIASKQKNSTD